MIPLKPLKEKRMAHCVSVAKLCYDLALAYDVDPMRAYLCGVFHDIAREIPEDEMIPLAKARNIPVGEASLDGIAALELTCLADEFAICVERERVALGESCFGVCVFDLLGDELKLRFCKVENFAGTLL